MTLGTRIAHARDRNRLTQNELAERLGIHPMTLSKWERGEQIPRRTTLLALGETLGVSVDWLESGRGSEPQAQVSIETQLLASAILLADRLTQAFQQPVPIEKRALLIAQLVELCKQHGVRDASRLPPDCLWRVG
ncbi:MAG: helix-turn-helix transcriptional regulator [Acidobacteria bacterium]|nr:helix-turn-helix transcriptional regulator [Acidobacteriota bacterium]